ncbi:MAG: Kelch repeat-containing protein [SAR324 cluster bacterium]
MMSCGNLARTGLLLGLAAAALGASSVARAQESGEGPQILTADLTRRQVITTDTFRISVVIVDEEPIVEVLVNGVKENIEPDQAIALNKEIDNRREETVVTITAKNRSGHTREKSFLVVNPAAKGRFGEAAPVVVVQKDRWERSAELQTPRAGPAAAAVGDTVYVFGGYTRLSTDYDTGLSAAPDKSEYVKTAESFGEKKPPTPMPEAPFFETLPAAAVLGGRIYVFESRRHLHEYDPATSSWKTQDSPIRLNRIGPAAAAGDNIYIFGGLFGVTSKDAAGAVTIQTRASPLFWRYTPKINTWAVQGYMPLPRSGAAACAVRDRIYVLGGINGDTVFNRLDIYATAADRWSVGAPMPTARAYAACAVVNNRVLVFGGQTAGAAAVTGGVDEYAPEENAWTARAPAPTARAQAAAAILNGATYVTGGIAAEALSVTEVYR